MDDVDKRITLAENRATIERDLAESESERDLSRKNSPFTQLDDVGMSSLKRVVAKSSKAGALFLALMPLMDRRGAVVASNQTLADIAGVNVTNVSKLVKTLIDAGLLRKLKNRGLPVYAFNPDVAWRSYGSAKKYAMFHATVVISEEEYEDDPEFDIRRGNALVAMAKESKKPKGRPRKKTKPETPDLPPPVGEKAEEPEVL